MMMTVKAHQEQSLCMFTILRTTDHFKFPQKPFWRREAWIRAVSRLELDPATGQATKKTWVPNESSRICSVHFIDGRPSEELGHPDHIPTLNLKGLTPSKRKSVERYQRSVKKRKTEPCSTDTSVCDTVTAAAALIELSDQHSFTVTGTQTVPLKETEVLNKLELENKKKDKLIKILQGRIDQLSAKLKSAKYSYHNCDDKDIKFYTGIRKELFLWIYDQLYPYIARKKISKDISLHDHLFLVLAKIKLDVLNKELSKRFQISETTVSHIWNTWAPLVSERLKDAIIWPQQDVARSNIPESYKPEYRKCVSIIDCFEIFMERPFNLTARAQTWSNYKHHNTIKYLISITPSGAVNFLSTGWGGRVSDKEITLSSGYMDKLLPGDEVLADRVFLVTEEMACRGVVLRTPSFTKGKKQLSGKEVEMSRKLSHLRIHVERVIGRMRKFRILDSTLSVSQIDRINDIVVIVAALHNLMPSIVPT